MISKCGMGAGEKRAFYRHRIVYATIHLSDVSINNIRGEIKLKRKKKEGRIFTLIRLWKYST